MARKHGDTAIRWTSKTWNPVSGCIQITPGCDHCYAKQLAEQRRGTPAFPVGFDPVLKANRLHDPSHWKEPAMIFVNSMSDLFLGTREVVKDREDADALIKDGGPWYWSRDYLDAVFDEMRANPRHVYQVLTKRPRLMLAFFVGSAISEGYLSRRGLQAVPDYIWPGTTIENDSFTWRANVLREIPARVRMISAEPLLTALPSLDLTGLGWVIVGGESGSGFRPMPHEWAADLRDRCLAAGVPYFFKQSAAYRTEMGQELEGERWEQYPDVKPDATRLALPSMDHLP